MLWYADFNHGTITCQPDDGRDAPRGHTLIAVTDQEMRAWLAMHVLESYRNARTRTIDFRIRDQRLLRMHEDSYMQLFYGPQDVPVPPPIQANQYDRVYVNGVLVQHAYVAVDLPHVVQADHANANQVRNANQLVYGNFVQIQPGQDGNPKAATRARELLLKHLTEAQRKSYTERGFFVMEGRSGNRYQLSGGYVGNVGVFERRRYIEKAYAVEFTPDPELFGGRDVNPAMVFPETINKRIPVYEPVRSLCIHVPDGSLPHEDNVLAQKLMIENDEQQFLQLAYPSSQLPPYWQYGVAMEGDEA